VRTDSLVRGCPHAAYEFPALPLAAEVPRDAVAALVAHLYLCQVLSTYRIGQVAGIDRQRVGRLLAAEGVPVKPRGAGRPRVRDDRQAALDELMAWLYAEAGWTSVQIAELTGVAQRTVRERLRARGVRMHTRGRLNREDRVEVPADAVAQLYVAAGLSAAETGKLLGISRQIVLRSAHDEGMPVRVGGPEPGRGPAEIKLVEALYADPLVQVALSRHGIASRPAGGQIWQRFPVPLPLSAQLAEELYARCGLGIRHIELLTGQPAQTVLRLLTRYGIARRPPGGRTPFLRRWRAGYPEGAGRAHSAPPSLPQGPVRQDRPTREADR
jgi:hypothetical protein